MKINRIRLAYEEGRPSFGTYVGTPSPRVVELLGFTGLDFVRIDLDGAAMNIETVQDMIRAAHAVGVTPIVRVPVDVSFGEWYIHTVLQMGALGVIVPRVTGRADAEAAVRAAKPPPLGDSHVGPSGFLGGYGRMSSQEYLDWARDNIVLSVQVETKGAVDAIEEIVSVPGLDMVQSGRGDLSREYGVPGQQYHPVVLEAQKRVIEAGLQAGKMVALQYYPLRDPNQMETIREWIRLGVQCFSLGTDRDIVTVYRRLLEELRT